MYKSYHHHILEGYKNYYEVYTDASKTLDGVGISIILENQYTSFKLPNTCSILYTAEATAILEAIITNKKHSTFLILSDSLSTLNNIKKNKLKPGDLCIKTQNKFNEASSIHKQIILMWIPGHIGIKGNEIADLHLKNSTNDIDLNIR